MFYWLDLNGVEATRSAGAGEYSLNIFTIFRPKCAYFWHIFGVFKTKCVYLRPNEYIYVQWGWFSGGYKGFSLLLQTVGTQIRAVVARK